MSYLILRVLGAIFILTLIGCGQPRVHVVTSTTLGLEATPPMSDGSGVPRVTVGYKRAEFALIPVCPVDQYMDPFSRLTSLIWKLEIPPCLDNNGSQAAASKASTLTRTVQVNGTTKENATKRQDSYSTLGIFRMGLSWFGPARIEQFVATGQAAVELQKTPDPPRDGSTSDDQNKSTDKNKTETVKAPK